MIYDTAFVGAGPASLAAALQLSAVAGRRKIAIFDAGVTGAARCACPGLKNATCTSCAGEHCHVTMGLGGASATFGNKHCSFPASSGVLALMPTGLRTKVLNAVSESLGMPLSFGHSASAENRKEYEANIVYRRQYMALMEAMSQSLPHDVNVTLGSEIARVDKSDDGIFSLVCSDGTHFRTHQLVLGVGRSGHKFLRRILSDLGVAYDEPAADVGFRLEVNTDDIDDQFLYQVDPKYKFDHAGMGTSRTFCTCIGGQIVPVKFGEGFYADGAFLNAPTSRTNIAFMARSNIPFRIDDLENWCASVNRANGSTLRLGCNIEVGGDANGVEKVMSVVGPQPSATHAAIISELLHHTLGGTTAPLLKSGRIASVNIYGPAIDAFWPLPHVMKNFRTECDGLSIIGDAVGASRGIVQAIASGIAWALAETGSLSLPASSTQPETQPAEAIL